VQKYVASLFLCTARDFLLIVHRIKASIQLEKKTPLTMLLSPIATPLALTMLTLYFDETGNNQNAI